MLSGETWPKLANCKGGDPDALFVDGAEQNIAKRICRGCPVKYECLADALDNRIEFGVWGGMTERERRALLRRHPVVSSWRITLASQAAEQHTETARLAAIRKLAQPVGQVAASGNQSVAVPGASGAAENAVSPLATTVAESAVEQGEVSPAQNILLPIQENLVV